MTEKEIQLTLSNIVSYVLKKHDAPMSAESHLDHAIAVLSEYCHNWKPLDDSAEAVVKDAREHASYYFKWAEKPWPIKGHECLDEIKKLNSDDTSFDHQTQWGHIVYYYSETHAITEDLVRSTLAVVKEYDDLLLHKLDDSSSLEDLQDVLVKLDNQLPRQLELLSYDDPFWSVRNCSYRNIKKKIEKMKNSS